MHNDDSFNDSDEIFNLYSSKKVTETFKSQFQELISNHSSLKNGTANPNTDEEKEEKEAKEQSEEEKEIDELREETPPAKETARPEEVKNVLEDSVEIVSDCVLEDSVEIVGHCVPKRGTRQSARLRNKRGRTMSSLSDSDRDSPIIINKKRKPNKGRRKKNNSIDEVVLIDSPENLDEDELNPEVSVKVIWKSVSIKKYKIRKFQKMGKIFEELSNEENIPEDKIMLTFNNVKVNRNDTPDSLNLQVYHFLDGGVLSELTNSCDTSNSTNSDVNAVTIKFQDVNKKIIKVTVGRDEKMKIGMIKCSEQLEVGLDKIKFFFDGELLDPLETPSSLDFENDEVIDIKICE